MSLAFKIAGQLAIKDQLALLKMPEAKRKRLLNRALLRVRAIERKRLNKQTDVNNQPFAPRKEIRPGQKKKMLTGLGKKLAVIKLTPNYGVLGWYDRRTAKLAKSHNEGDVITGSTEQLKKKRRTSHGKPATKEQLRSLKLLNYRIKAKGGKYIRPTAAWLNENMTYNKAGLIIRLLNNSHVKATSDQWTMVLPKREFNGVSNTEQNQLISLLIGQMLNAPK